MQGCGLIQHAGRIGAGEKPFAPRREIRPWRIAPDIHTPGQGGHAPKHQIAQRCFCASHGYCLAGEHTAFRQIIVARVKPIFVKHLQPQQKAF
jgi:hypothetical protein